MSSTVTPSRRDSQRLSDAAEGEHPVLYFDGVCGLCNRAIDFVMRHDREGIFRFAPLQGETAKAQLSAADVSNLNSMVLATPAGTYRKSAAAVRILWRLGSFWKLLGGLLWIIPGPLRDVGYSCVAAVRYRVFGKHETCRLPTPEEWDRFLP